MTAVTSPYNEIPEREFEVFAPLIIDLNGAASSQIIHPVPDAAMWGSEDSGSFAYVIKELIVIATTTFAAAGTDNLLLGKSGGGASAYAHHSYSTPNGTAAGTVLRIDQSLFNGEERVIRANKNIEIACIGALGAAGACRVGVKLSRRYSEWNGYVANRL